MSVVNSKTLTKTIAIGATDANYFSGTRFEYAPATGELNIYGSGSAIGLTLRMLVGAGEAIETSELSAANRIPTIPDDLIMGSIPVFEGQKITVQVANPTAGALTSFLRIELEV